MRRDIFFHYNSQLEHPHSHVLAAIPHNNYSTNPESDALKLLGSLPAIHYYRIHIYQLLFIKLQNWWSQEWKTDFSTTTGLILNLFMGGCWAWRQLYNHIRYVSIATKLRKSLFFLERISVVLMIFFSTADYFTVAWQILNLFIEGCWTWYPLDNSIRYVPVDSKLRKLLSSLESILTVTILTFHLTGDYISTT